MHTHAHTHTHAPRPHTPQVHYIPTFEVVGRMEASRANQYFELLGIQANAGTFVAIDKHCLHWKNLGGALKYSRVTAAGILGNVEAENEDNLFH